MKSYVDASVLVACYVSEALSRSVDELVRSLRPPQLSDLTVVEFQSAIARKTRLGERADNARRVRHAFGAHLDSFQYRRLLLERATFRRAAEWIERLPVALRTLDGLHLALASEHRMRLITADRQLAEAARSLNLEYSLLRP